jgi:hypothetical protein
MTRQGGSDPWTALGEAARAAAAPGQPAVLFDAVERALAQVIGHKLFTILEVDLEEGDLERIYTNMAEAYPVKGRKAMGPTPWGEWVLTGKRPYLGRTREDIRWAFYDHELIESLGCGSVINLLVMYGGTLLGTVNMLHEEGYYTDDDLVTGVPFAALLAPALLARRRAPTPSRSAGRG